MANPVVPLAGLLETTVGGVASGVVESPQPLADERSRSVTPAKDRYDFELMRIFLDAGSGCDPARSP
jgi:hypothetical protein